MKIQKKKNSCEVKVNRVLCECEVKCKMLSWERESRLLIFCDRVSVSTFDFLPPPVADREMSSSEEIEMWDQKCASKILLGFIWKNLARDLFICEKRLPTSKLLSIDPNLIWT